MPATARHATSSSNQYSCATCPDPAHALNVPHRSLGAPPTASRSANRQSGRSSIRPSDEALRSNRLLASSMESTSKEDAHERLVPTHSHCPLRRRRLERRDSAAADPRDLRRLGGRRAPDGSARLARRASARRPVRRRWRRADGEGTDRVPHDRHGLAVRPRCDPRRSRAADPPLVDGPRGALAPLAAEPAQRPRRRSRVARS